jgi:hypothetical protein
MEQFRLATIVTVAFPPLQSIAVVTAALVKANTGGWFTSTVPTGPQLFASVLYDGPVPADTSVKLRCIGSTVKCITVWSSSACSNYRSLWLFHHCSLLLLLLHGVKANTGGWFTSTVPVTGPQLFASVKLYDSPVPADTSPVVLVTVKCITVWTVPPVATIVTVAFPPLFYAVLLLH